MRALPQRILIERGGGSGGETLRAQLDPTNLPADLAGPFTRLLDETHPPAADDEPEVTAYDVVLDYGDHEERLRYDEAELPGPIREALDAQLKQAG